jgi:hypothetical protein
VTSKRRRGRPKVHPSGAERVRAWRRANPERYRAHVEAYARERRRKRAKLDEGPEVSRPDSEGGAARDDAEMPTAPMDPRHDV